MKHTHKYNGIRIRCITIVKLQVLWFNLRRTELLILRSEQKWASQTHIPPKKQFFCYLSLSVQQWASQTHRIANYDAGKCPALHWVHVSGTDGGPVYNDTCWSIGGYEAIHMVSPSVRTQAVGPTLVRVRESATLLLINRKREGSTIYNM